MTDEARSLEQTARDLYGGEYHEDPRSEPVRQEADTAAAGLSMEGALERLRESREVSPEPPQERAPAESRHEHEAPADDALWTSAEAEDLASFQQEAQRLQHDLALFERARQIDLAEVERQDRGRAQALRVQMSEAEAELRQRHERLQGVAKQIQATAQARQQQRIEQHLAAEQRKLNEEMPDLDRAALGSYLLGSGFTREEIDSAADARLVILAEKARRYDEMSKQGATRKVPKMRKGASRQSPSKPRGKVAAAQARFQRSRSMSDAAELLTAQREEARNG